MLSFSIQIKHFITIVFVLCVPALISCTQKSNKKIFNPLKKDTLFRSFPAEPEILHPIRSTDIYATKIQELVFDRLLTRNTETYELESHLAKKWKTDTQNKTFTFTIRPNVQWHDGKPLTTKDIVFSFKAYKDPSFGGIHFLSYLENIESATALDEWTVQFKYKQKYFGDLQVLGSLFILPEHIYKDKTKKLNYSLIGSGPYTLKRYDRGKKILLEKNPIWWGNEIKKNQHRIPYIIFRFIHDENDQLARMAGGDLDFLKLSIESYMKKTNKSPWGESILKKSVTNKEPAGYWYIGFNFKKDLFQSKKVRKALTYLANRQLINEKFFYGKTKLATGPWYSWSNYADPSVKAIPFDPQKARKLLAEDGWEDSDKNGILDKTLKGKKIELKFSLLFPTKDVEKYLTIYQEDLKKNGIQLSLQFMDWSAFLKVVKEQNFDTVGLGWSAGSIDLDPKQIWHSKSARKGGSNHISYVNPEVDRLIDEGRAELDKAKRIKIFQKVYRLIAEDYPYIFLFNNPIQYYAISKKVQLEKDVYPYSLGLQYWQLTK